MIRSRCESVATGQKGEGPRFERRSLLDELASKGVRITAQRRALAEIIQNATEHLDAAALLGEAQTRESGIDRATVYRTLDLLKKLGLVDELDLMHLNGEKHYYEVKSSMRSHSSGRFRRPCTSPFRTKAAPFTGEKGTAGPMARARRLAVRLLGCY